MKKAILVLLGIMTFSLMGMAQVAPLNGWCQKGATKAVVSGLSSSNYLDGVIPSCSVTIYLPGTLTKATLYSDAIGTHLGNPFTANNSSSTQPGYWLAYAAIGQTYDVVRSGGIAPNVYLNPVTIKVALSSGGGGGGATPGVPQFSLQFNDPLGTFGGSGDAIFGRVSGRLEVGADSGGSLVVDNVNGDLFITDGSSANLTSTSGDGLSILTRDTDNPTSDSTPLIVEAEAVDGKSAIGVDVQAKKYSGTPQDLYGVLVESMPDLAVNKVGAEIGDVSGASTESDALHILDQGAGSTDFALKVEGGQTVFKCGASCPLPTHHETQVNIFSTGAAIPFIVHNNDGIISLGGDYQSNNFSNGGVTGFRSDNTTALSLDVNPVAIDAYNPATGAGIDTIGLKMGLNTGFGSGDVRGIDIRNEMGGAIHGQTLKGIQIGDVHGGSTESDALLIDDQGAGSTDYAIKTGTGKVSFGGAVTAPSIAINGGTPITSASSANSQVVTCPTGGSSTQYCGADGVWHAASAGSVTN